MYGIYSNGEKIATFSAPLNVHSNSPVYVADALSLRRNISQRSVQRWEIQGNLVPLSSGAQDLMVLIVTKGAVETFQISMPQNYGVIKTRQKGSGVVTATGSVNSSQVMVAGNGGFMPKGTFIRFNGHSKVYMTTSDLNGSGAVGIYPSLRAAVNGTFSNWDTVMCDVRFDTDMVRGMAYTDGILMDFGTLKFVEAL